MNKLFFQIFEESGDSSATPDTYAQSYTLIMRPNVKFGELQSGGKFQFVSPSTVPTGGNYGATLNTVTKSGDVLTNGWYSVAGAAGGAFGAKLMFSNTGLTTTVMYGFGLRARTSVAGSRAVTLNVSGSAAVALSGQVMGGEFYLQNSGLFTIADPDGHPSCALHVKSWLTAACADTASALWIDDESTTKATTQYMVNITMNGDVEIDKVFHIYGGDPGADTFIDFDTCDQGAGAFVVATASGGATRSHKIKCTVNGSTAGYLSLYTD